MANAPRTAKSADSWTQKDLDAYNISVSSQDAPTFFGLAALPRASIDPEILAVNTYKDLSEESLQYSSNLTFLAQLDTATHPLGDAEFFTRLLLERMGYAAPPRVALMSVTLPLRVCGERQEARMDACVVDEERGEVVLVVMEAGQGRARGTIVAGAVAAFQMNNVRREARGVELLEETVRVFSVLPSPASEGRTVGDTGDSHGGDVPRVPDEATVVLEHVPGIPPEHMESEGMRPLGSRRVILGCFEAFRRFVVRQNAVATKSL